ncbi:Emerin [Dissostichus eleginoides]|uniref:Emerin n=1 Tax=Dissostichus eleginoides TaxID=100907 RepID=A0AAD9CB36_DISEL|nr:Emerin [Dissostichus eleginoides]
MSLREKSDKELSKLLSESGIKHGPIVDSTRKLYEKKLEKAMEDAPLEVPSPDKTFYREEAEEVTYITYHHSPVRQEVYSDGVKRRGNAEPDQEEEPVQYTEPPVQISKRTANHSAAPQIKEPKRESGCSVWKGVRLLLLLAVLAAALYYAYCRVVNSEEDPFGIQ